jgi:hypothetical protein
MERVVGVLPTPCRRSSRRFRLGLALALLSAGAAGSDLRGAAMQDPFANSSTPPPPGYPHPLFRLSHDYPLSPPGPLGPTPWDAAIGGGPISVSNAAAFMKALSGYVSADLAVFVLDHDNWDAGRLGWYDQPWLSTIQEPICGMFLATQTEGALFKGSGLRAPYLIDFAKTYYNRRAASTLGAVWGSTAMSPNISTAASQFPEGSIIIKFTYTEAGPSDWPVMEGANHLTIFTQRNPGSGGSGKPELFNVRLMQLDIVVKDSIAAPKTGWVFTTLVYDARVKGDGLERMVPLGATWGNDPEVNSAAPPVMRLGETWLNPQAPDYSTEILGWGGRLSGPNDQAVQVPGSYIDIHTGQPGKVTVANSACMSCHSPSEWQPASFILPGFVLGCGYVMYAPGSADWMRWFQDRDGKTPQDEGSVAFDYDLMFTFKALPQWASATGLNVGSPDLFLRLGQMRTGGAPRPPAPPLLNYNGLPLN